jgi:transcription antitermination factor NusG
MADWSGWIVATTANNAERKAISAMSAAGFTNWLPEFEDDRKRPRMLFRGYLFVLASWNNWHNVYKVRGINSVLMGAGTGIPALVNSHSMSLLRARRNSGGMIELPTRFEVGQQLIVREGPFEGKLALYQGMSSKQREQVLFQMLGRSVVAEFDYGALEAA